MNSARRDLEALNVLTGASGAQGLFEVPISELTDEQLDEALRLLARPEQQPLTDQRDGDLIVGEQGVFSASPLRQSPALEEAEPAANGGATGDHAGAPSRPSGAW